MADLRFTCERGHHVVAKRGVPITSHTKCPAAVYRDSGKAAVEDDPFSNPGVQKCGADVDTVNIDIYDYEEGRFT